MWVQARWLDLKKPLGSGAYGEVWMAGVYVAMIQLGGGIGSIAPANFAEYIVFTLGACPWPPCMPNAT